MVGRTLERAVHKAAKQMPVITLTGPRQAGKTTLSRAAFPVHRYFTLENPDDRRFALEDPRGFMELCRDGAILDEVQRVPDLLSYIQGAVDEDPTPGRFILTGSQNLLLLEGVSQSLAGRTALLHLLPLSQAELRGETRLGMDDTGKLIPGESFHDEDLFRVLHRGGYPRIHDQNLEPGEWLPDYIETYVERDVRALLNVGDAETFGRFIRLCAGRSGQLLNLSSLGADCGISHTTARRWLSFLEASYIVYLLRPFHSNLSKRLVRSPKLHFVDTGLLCFLLGIRSPEDLAVHSQRGAVFETFVVSELLKACYHHRRQPDFYFWRDHAGKEIDIILDQGATQVGIEVKSGATIASDFFDALKYWRSFPGQAEFPAALVYGGTQSRMQQGVAAYSWKDWM